MFDIVISKTRVRNGIFAYKMQTGVICIGGERYFFYSIKEAIKTWRSKH